MTAVTMQEKTSAPVSVEATKDIVVANIVKTASAKEKPKSAGIQAFEEAGEVNQPTDLIENEDGSKAFMLANGDAYSFGPLGVFFTRRDGSPMPVCGPLEVVAKVRSSEGEDWRLALKWTDQDGHFRQGLIPCSALMKSPAQVVAYLADNGLEIRHAINSQGGSAYIVNFLNRFPVRARVLGVDHHGWVNHGEAFSIPRLGIIGKSETSGIIYTGDPKSEPVYAEKETLTDWQEKIGKPAMFSSRIGFAICLGFAAPLLEFTSEESGGFHFYGESSKGKSTCARALCSLWGPANERGEMGTWRTTDNGLESAAAAHTHLPLILDEIGQASPALLASIIYMLGNERGKGRATKGLEARRVLTWRLLFLSTGEETIEDYAAKAPGKKGALKEGVKMRMADIPAAAGGPEFGVFDGEFDPTKTKDERLALAAQYANQINTSSKSEAYGTAGPAFIRALIAHIVAIGVSQFESNLREQMSDWVNKHCGTKDTQIVRVARRCALIAKAGELAIRFGVLPWTAGMPSEFAAKCFKAWRAEYKTAEMQDRERVLYVVEKISANRGRFALQRPGSETLIQAASALPCMGVLKVTIEDIPTEAFINRTLFDAEFCPVGDVPKVVLSALAKQGLLKQNDRSHPHMFKASGPIGKMIAPHLSGARCVYVVMPVVESSGNSA